MINADSLQPAATMEKKRARNIGSKCRRLLMRSEDVLELRLTWEEAQDLLHPPPCVKPTLVTIEDHEFEEYDEPPVFGKKTIFTSRPSGEQEQWAQCDDCSKWRRLPLNVLLPPKWTCLDNVWDLSRCACSAPEETNPKELDNIIRENKELKKRRGIESRTTSQECEASGLEALASAAVLGDGGADFGEPSAGATTKHPRHRAGCTCIVCIQPPSGTGKHKPTCICNVCMTVRRRFKTLMLRKKKRQSEGGEVEGARRETTTTTTTTTTSSHGDLHRNTPDNEAEQCGKHSEAPETSAGEIDLNCHPENHEELEPSLTTSLLLPDCELDQNGFSSFMCKKQTECSFFSAVHCWDQEKH